MKKIKFMLFAVAAMAAASCAKEVAPEVSAPVEVNYVEMEFSSALETTKTALDGSSVVWIGNETISILDNSASPKNTKATTVSGAPGTFKATVPEATEYYAAYPYRSNIALNGSKLTNWYLAQVQTPSAGSFDKTRAPMVAKADANNNFAFRNIASHVRVTIPADMTDVMAITLMGNEDELITGIYDVDWNNGDPTYSFPKLAEAYPYVTLRKGDKTPIAPGQYYFTILPVEFKKGFTLIFAKTDGTQVAVRTDKPVTTVSKRNQIQPMKEAPSSAFKSHMNYFVHYDNGFDLDISGYIVNNTLMSSKKVVLVTDTKENGLISNTSGYLYFVSPNCSIANTGTKTLKDIMILGWDASKRSTMTLTGHMNLSSTGTYYILSNLDILGITNNGLPIRGDISTFGDVVFSNCGFKAMTGTTTLQFNSSSNNSTKLNILVIEDCEFEYNTTTASYLMSDRAKQGEYKILKVNNNIFHGNVGSFRLLNIGNSADVGSSVDSLIVTNNTVANLPINNGQMIVVRNIYDMLDFSGNLFCMGDGAKLQAFSMPGSGRKPSSSKRTIVDNYYYSTAAEMNVSFGFGEHTAALPLASYPLSDLWDPANGKFGAYSIVPAAGAPAPTGPVGAQRPDMDPVTAAVNSAAYGYETNDLGKL